MVRLPYPCPEIIIAEVQTWSNDKQTLRTCSLVSTEWRKLAVPPLFATVHIRTFPSLTDLVTLLQSPKSDRIAPHVKTLTLGGDLSSWLYVDKRVWGLIMVTLRNVEKITLDHIVWYNPPLGHVQEFFVDGSIPTRHVKSLHINGMCMDAAERPGEDPHCIVPFEVDHFVWVMKWFKQIDKAFLSLAPPPCSTTLVPPLQDRKNDRGKSKEIDWPTILVLSIPTCPRGDAVLKLFYRNDKKRSIRIVTVGTKYLEQVRALGDILSARDNHIPSVYVTASYVNDEFYRVDPNQISTNLRLPSCKVLVHLQSSVHVRLNSSKDSAASDFNLILTLLAPLSPETNPKFRNVTISFSMDAEFSPAAQSDAVLRRFQRLPWRKLRALLINKFAQTGLKLSLVMAPWRPVTNRIFDLVTGQLSGLEQHGLALERLTTGSSSFL